MKKRVYDFLFRLLECLFITLANLIGWLNRRLT